MIYKYRVNCNPLVIKDILLLDPVYDKLTRLDIGEYKTDSDNVTIETENPLTSEEQDKILSLLINNPEMVMFMKRNYLEENISTPAISMGFSLIAKYAAMNMAAEKTQAQFVNMFSITGPMMLFLMSGSLEMALGSLMHTRANLPNDGSVTALECDEFIRRLQVHIKELKG